MKSAWFNSALLIALVSIGLFACKDKPKSTTVTPAPVAGKGGLATMRVVMDNDSLFVDSGKVYIKYNASVTPANKKFDDSANIFMVDGTPMAIFTELTQGDYFLYGKGWDIRRSQTVMGTRPYTIPASGDKGINYLILQVTPQ